MDNRLPHPVLAAYEALSLLTDRMLEAARAQDWDQLVELEKECRRLAEALQTASDAALTLEEQRRKAAIIRKVLESAIANAEHNEGADIDELRVTSIYVEQGTTLKRFTARAKGRGNRISKPTCHIYLTVGDEPRAKA